jgi:hypothetical protein
MYSTVPENLDILFRALAVPSIRWILDHCGYVVLKVGLQVIYKQPNDTVTNTQFATANCTLS